MNKIKILLTGFKGIDNKRISRKRFRDLIDFADWELSKDSDYEVSRHLVTCGDNLSKYDIVLVFVNALNSITSTDTYGGLWAMAKAKCCLPVFVDWRFIDFQSNMQHSVRGDVPFVKRFFNEKLIAMGIRRGAVEAKKHASELEAYLKKVSSKGYGDILFWAFNWKNLNNLDREKLKCHGKIFTIDPSAYHLNKITQMRMIRREGWVLDAISDIKPKLIQHAEGREWPIIGTGHPSLFKMDNVYNPFEPKMKSSFENASALYARYYGAIGFSYPHSGFGWWRQRVVIAADNMTVYIGDEKEVSLMGECYKHKCKDIEKMDKSDIIDLAKEQREWLLANTDTKARFVRRLKYIITEKLDRG